MKKNRVIPRIVGVTCGAFLLLGGFFNSSPTFARGTVHCTSSSEICYAIVVIMPDGSREGHAVSGTRYVHPIPDPIT